MCLLAAAGLLFHALHPRKRGRDLPRKTLSHFLQFVLLILIFTNTSMWVGFGIYFLIWHALTSLTDQLLLLRTLKPGYTIWNYYRLGSPFWAPPLVSMALLLIVFARTDWLSTFLATRSLPSGIGLPTVLIGMACALTPPHLVAMTWLRIRARSAQGPR